MPTQRGNGPPFYPATAMQPIKNPIIQIYPHGFNHLFTVEFAHPDGTHIIGNVITQNYKAIKRITRHWETPYDVRSKEAQLSLWGFTVNEAYEALEYEFINQ